jgi:hypothetical protein
VTLWYSFPEYVAKLTGWLKILAPENVNDAGRVLVWVVIVAIGEEAPPEVIPVVLFEEFPGLLAPVKGGNVYIDALLSPVTLIVPVRGGINTGGLPLSTAMAEPSDWGMKKLKSPLCPLLSS